MKEPDHEASSLWNLDLGFRQKHGLDRLAPGRSIHSPAIFVVPVVYKAYVPPILRIVRLPAGQLDRHGLAFAWTNFRFHAREHEVSIAIATEALVGNPGVRETVQKNPGKGTGRQGRFYFVNVVDRVLATGKPGTIRLPLEGRPALALHALPTQRDPCLLGFALGQGLPFRGQPLFKGSGHVRLLSQLGGLLRLFQFRLQFGLPLLMVLARHLDEGHRVVAILPIGREHPALIIRVEECEKLVEFLLGDRIILVIMATGAS